MGHQGVVDRVRNSSNDSLSANHAERIQDRRHFAAGLAPNLLHRPSVIDSGGIKKGIDKAGS